MENDGTIPGSLDELIAAHGVPLGIEGLKGIGFAPVHAREALDILEHHGVTAVLGGDVYWIVEGDVDFSPDHWACDSKVPEPWRTYVQRSIAYARRYIERYTPPADTQECIYVFVVETH